jgi:hypothetical protein
MEGRPPVTKASKGTRPSSTPLGRLTFPEIKSQDPRVDIDNVQAVTKRKHDDVPIDTLSENSVWFKSGDNSLHAMGTCFIAFIEKENPVLGSQHSIKKPGSDKGRDGLFICCCTDVDNSRKNATCNLHIIGHRKGLLAERSYVKSICKHHSAGCSVLVLGGRPRATQVRHLPPIHAKKHLSAVALIEGAHLAGGTQITDDQAYRAIKHAKKDEYYLWLEDLTYLIPYFLELRKKDPLGIYIVFTKPLSYFVPGAPVDAVELDGFIMIPSFLMDNFWRHCSARVVCIDFAHRKGQFLGSQCSTVSSDGYEGNLRTSYAQLHGDTKVSWERMTAAIEYCYPGIALVLADGAKGLEAKRLTANEEATTAAEAKRAFISQSNATQARTPPRGGTRCPCAF